MACAGNLLVDYVSARYDVSHIIYFLDIMTPAA